MAALLGLGVSHYPPFAGPDEAMAGILRARLRDPGLPATAKDPATWPAAMRAEWGEDEGRAAAAGHRAAMLAGFDRVRAALDAFDPDLVLIWGDDQYENFREDGVPAFSVQAYDDMDVRPWRQAGESSMFAGGRPNWWGEPADHALRVRGHREAALALVEGLLGEGFDVAYAYRPRHHPGLPHAFLNAILYLDHARRGFPWPVLPFALNCYGRQVLSHCGFASPWAERGRAQDPPSPHPWRCFDLGAAVARTLLASPWRVALVASSSWSHAFLVDKHFRLWPDIASDRELHRALVAGDAATWRGWPLARLEEAGQQEVLNWFCLVGAMHALGARLAWSDFVETHVFNSSKVAAVFEPVEPRR
jgi:hypothetical protein